MSMPASYEFTAQERPGYVHARVVGDRTPENARRFLLETYRACVAAGKECVLLEIRFRGPSLDVPSIFEVISKGSPDGMRMRKIAYVDATTEDPSKARFAETVAKNRGVNVRLFSGVDEAARWLEDEPA